MDAFYASVEQRDDPTLKGRPVIVGIGTLGGSRAPRDGRERAEPVLARALIGHAQRGVVLAASYEVRPFGVRSAMPMARALRLAPDAVVVPPRFDVYSDVSSRVFDILQTVTPLYEPLSLDEAFLDVTASRSLFGSPAEIARNLRARIAGELGLPSSAGIAACKLIAKIASDLAKPDGQLEVPADGGAAFLAPLPVARIPGIGPKSARQLQAIGITTVGDLAAQDPAYLERRFGPGGRELWDRARGVDPRPVVPDRDAKSVGAEETFDEDLSGVEALRPRVHAQALRVAHRLRRAGVRARTIQLKLKRADFTIVTRRMTLDEPTDDGQTLYREAARLLEREPPLPTRLTGVSAQNLTPAAAPQLGLFAAAARPTDKLNRALDAITSKFGSAAITTGDIAAGPGDDPTRRAPPPSELTRRAPAPGDRPRRRTSGR
ncbi:MAG TPA: DNA polymerase IV [Polyangia bacterium]|nr:DNA polymerase IV [Polyangia bacterium]